MSDATRAGVRGIDLLRAELRKATSRRGVKVVALIALGTLLWLSWSNYKSVSDDREYIKRVQSALDDPNSREVSIREGFPEGGGRYPYYGPEITEEEYRERLESERLFSVLRVYQAKPALHLANSHRVTLNWFGTVAGVLLALLMASTLVGAEFRWGYWKTAATIEPRRGRLVLVKLLAIWLMLGIGLVVLLGLSFGLNAVFAEIYGLDQSVPSLNSLHPRLRPAVPTSRLEVGGLLGNLGAAWLSIGTFATFAIAAVVWARTTLAGPLASLGLLISDGALITPRVPALRHVSPVQQIAFLLPDTPRIGGEALRGLWFERMDKIVSFSGSGLERSLSVETLSTIPDWRALLVLAIWILVGTGIAILGLQRRDLPS